MPGSLPPGLPHAFSPDSTRLPSRYILDLVLKTYYDPLKTRGHLVLNPQGEPILRSAVQSN